MDLNAHAKFAFMLQERVDRLTDELNALQSRVTTFDTCHRRVSCIDKFFSSHIAFSVSINLSNQSTEALSSLHDNIYSRVFTIAKASFCKEYDQIVIIRVTGSRFNVSVTTSKPLSIPQTLVGIANAMPEEYTIGDTFRTYGTVNSWVFLASLEKMGVYDTPPCPAPPPCPRVFPLGFN